MRTIKIRLALVEAAEEEIRRNAFELYRSHTVRGDWRGDDDAKKQYAELLDLADRLAEALQ